MRRGLVIVMLVMSCGQVVADDELGRLFFTAEQRALLDQARATADADDNDAVAGDDAAFAALELPVEVAPEPSPPVRLDGYVARRTGAQTVWLNGLDSYQGNLGEIGIDAAAVRIEAKRVRVPVGDSAAGVLLKPGQWYDPATARISDAFDPQPGLDEKAVEHHD